MIRIFPFIFEWYQLAYLFQLPILPGIPQGWSTQKTISTCPVLIKSFHCKLLKNASPVLYNIVQPPIFLFLFFSKLNMLDPHKWLDRSFNGRRWLFVFIVFFIYCSKKEADTNTFLGSVKPSGGNKAKGQISKGVFQENIARQIYRKANIKIWRALFFWNTRFEIRSFGLLPTK